MTMLLQILTHTPRWVFALFALLLALGLQQLGARRVPLWRTLLMPLAMGGLALWGVLSAFGTPLAALLWAAVTLLVARALARRPAPAGTAWDAATRRFSLPGSVLPLLLMLGVFFTKYGAAVLLSLHPELTRDTAVALGLSTLYGLASGLFLGRALRLWRLALRPGPQALPALA
jgi:hypothetical protein